MNIFGRLRKLHEQIGVALVHAHLDALLNLFIFCIGEDVDLAQRVNVAEGKKRPQPEFGGGMRFDQGVLDDHAVFTGGEHHLLGKDHPADPVGHLRVWFSDKIADIFMPLRIVLATRVFVNP